MFDFLRKLVLRASSPTVLPDAPPSVGARGQHLTDRRVAEERRLLEEEYARRAAESGAEEARRAHQEELRQREQLRVTLRSIGDAVIVVDLNSAVTFLNPVAEELTGWPSSEAAGQPLERIF